MKIAKESYGKVNGEEYKKILDLLTEKQLAELLHYIFYYNYDLSGFYKIDDFIGLTSKIDKVIIIDMIISNNITNIFNLNNLVLGKNYTIKFLEEVNYKNYLKFKSLIFSKKYKKDKFYYIIVKKFIQYTETKKYNSFKRKSIEEEFDSYYDALKNNRKGRKPKKK